MSTRIKVSLNKIAEFAYASARRKEAIVRDQKNKTAFKAAGYKKVEDILPRYFDGQMDTQILQSHLTTLSGLHSLIPSKEYSNGINGLNNLISFSNLNINGNVRYESLPMNASDGLEVEGVFINMRPECLVIEENKCGVRVGALKLHFPMSTSLGEKAGVCAATMLFEYLNQASTLPGKPKSILCYCLDVPQNKAYKSSSACVAALANMEAACRHYSQLWTAIP